MHIAGMSKQSPPRGVKRRRIPPPFWGGSRAQHTPRCGIGCPTPCEIIVLGQNMTPPMDFSVLTPLPPLYLGTPPFRGLGGLGGGWGVGWWWGGGLLCVLWALCVDSDRGPEKLFVYMDPLTPGVSDPNCRYPPPPLPMRT